MAQSGFTPILLYASGTASAAPTAGNLTSSASGAELALNYADGKLFYKDSGGNVQTLASKATGSIGGSDTQVQYNSSGALAGSANLTFNGTTLTANALTVSTGNLAFTSTAQRIVGDMSNATLANRLAFQTSTVNGNTVVQAVPNGTAITGAFRAYNNSDPTNAAFAQASVSSAETQFNSGITGTGTYLPMTFYTGGSEAMRIDTTRRVGIGGSPSVGGVQLTVLGGGTQLSPGTTAQEGLRVQRATGFATFTGINNDNNAYNGLQFFTSASAAATIDTSGNVGIGTASPGAVFHTVRTSAGAATVGAFIQNSDNTTSTEVRLAFAANSALLSADRYGWIGHVNTGGTNGGALTFATTPGGTAATERLRIDSSGNVGIGTASPGDRLDVVGGNIRIASGNTVRWVDAGNIRASIQGDSSSNAIFSTAGSERARITATGNIVAGASAALATTATDGFLYVPTCAGTPTGTPTAITGMAPIVVNTTNNKLYFYSGGVWRDAGP